MNLRQYIYTPTWTTRLVLAILLLAGALTTHAGVWPTASKKLATLHPESQAEAGTIENPYAISSANDLKYLSSKTELWSCCFVQTADIDLEGNWLGAMIGNKSIMFTGVYDGNGYEIQNMYIDWSVIDSSTKQFYGLFGCIGKTDGRDEQMAQVRNLNLRNIQLVREEKSITSELNSDLRIGLLAGAVVHNGSVENVSVINGKLTDSGTAPVILSVMAGGLIGDISSVPGGYNLMGASNGDVLVRNVAVQCDIDLSTVVRKRAGSKVSMGSSQYTQFNVGGILGRARRANYDQLPDNTFYTGSIAAPYGSVSPVWGLVRAGTDNSQHKILTDCYAAEIPGDEASIISTGQTAPKVTNVVARDKICKTDGSDPDYAPYKAVVPDANRRFGNYRVWDSSVDDYVTFDGDESAAGQYGIRTLEPNNFGPSTPSSKTFKFDNLADWRYYQGVNHGIYTDTDTEDGRSDILSMFNSYAAAQTGSNLQNWAYDATSKAFIVKGQANVKIARTDGTTFTVTITDSDNTDDVAVKWEGLSRASQKYEEIAVVGKELSLPTPDRYVRIRATLLDDNGEPLVGNYGMNTAAEILIPDVGVDLQVVGVKQLKTNVITDYADVPYSYAWSYSTDFGATYTELDVTNTPVYEFAYLPDQDLKIKVELIDAGGMTVMHTNGITPQAAETMFTTVNKRFDLNVEKVKISDTEFKYVASITDKTGALIDGGNDETTVEGYTWKWEVSSDPTNSSAWETVDFDESRYWIVPYYPDRYYRVSWMCGDLTVLQTVVGLRNMIYVYDKAMTVIGREKGVTSFDGLDHSDENNVVPYPDGDDVNDGSSPYRAVRTLERAYELCDPNEGVDGNIIVIMGYLAQKSPFNRQTNHLYNKCATITGRASGLISGGAMNLAGDTESTLPGIGGSTKFEKINLVGFHDPVAGDFTLHRLLLYCNQHDLTIGEDVKVLRFKLMDTGLGLITTTRVPDITIIGGHHNYNEASMPDYPDDTAVPGVCTITLNSGCWGRIINSGRNNGAYQPITHNIYGEPSRPHRGTIVVAISHPRNLGAMEYSEGYVDKNNVHQDWTHDIGLLVGGQTDGTTYTDSELYVNSGIISRFISGNISYGRSVGDEHPDDSFFGSTVVTLRGGSIDELYGGTLGRHDCSDASGGSATADVYFYGRSIINIEGGVVKNNIYGAGAGGVTGIGHCDITEPYPHHTLDKSIPYYNEEGQLRYGDYETVRTAGNTIPKVVLRDGTELDLDKSYCEVNINGGEVIGNIYGGGLGFSNLANYTKASSQAGTMFGDCKVTVRNKYNTPPVVRGNIYGASAGSRSYFDNAVADLVKESNKLGVPAMTRDEAEAWASAKFGHLAILYGNTTVDLEGGTVEGNVYGGGMGVGDFHEMTSIFGNTNLILNGATVIGNIFGGSAMSDVRRSHADRAGTGNTSVIVSDGIVGNNIYGGSEGTEDHLAVIEGNTSVVVTGGKYINDCGRYKVKDWNNKQQTVDRTFCIYGGGHINCDIHGNTRVYIEKSLLSDLASVSDIDGHSVPDYPEANYAEVLGRLDYRHFGVFGGGYGVKTLVRGNTDVHINILPDQAGGFIAPTSTWPTRLMAGQVFFDVSGGGYSGDVGFWAKPVVDATGNPVLDEDGKPTYTRLKDIIENTDPDDFTLYLGGDTKVTIEGYAFVRKVMGGGFYGSCNKTDTWLREGTIREGYGGSLLGYVHNGARLTVGTRAGNTGAGEYTAPAQEAAEKNRNLFITNDIYGGNDIEGIVGSQLWRDDKGRTAREPSDGGPVFCAEVKESTDKGVLLNLYGGNVMGNVYGAGNGYYSGYYVPDWVFYADGPDRQYRLAHTNHKNNVGGVVMNERTDAEGNKYYVDRVYRNRPMTGSVKLNISGNSTTDRVNIAGNVYGGGRSCTVGQWNPILPFEDPRRLDRGGYLHANIGSHVTVVGNVYMGANGENYIKHHTVPEEVAGKIRPNATVGIDRSVLQQLGDIAYDHWWWNTEQRRYEPGFPPPGTLDGNYGLTGEHMFRSYMKNIEMNGDVEITFYDDLYERDGDGRILIDADGNLQRKRWKPAELALRDYDATDVRMNSFFLGGQSGSMTNNRMKRYDYANGYPIDADDPAYKDVQSADLEPWGSIYRLVMPEGITVLNTVVGGSQDAGVTIYPFNSNFTEEVLTKPDGSDNAMYVFDGGVVTQANFTYDIIVYCDRHNSYRRDFKPDDYMMSRDDPAYDSYTLVNGPDAGLTIYRQAYTDNPFYPHTDNITDDEYGRQRYSLAVTKDGDGNITGAYVGLRDPRSSYTGLEYGRTVVKMTLANNFEPQPDSPEYANDADHLYGGLIYGGCYNSGRTLGDVVINIDADMLGKKISNDKAFDGLSSLRHNLGRAFGGGFGEQSIVEGNTYVNILHNARAMNVFGGGCRGNVTGKASVRYIGDDSRSFVFGNIYGGGLRGSVGTAGLTVEGTDVKLVSGNVSRVYGGSCMGDVYGKTNVTLIDEIGGELDHLDHARMHTNLGWSDCEDSKLIVGRVYGGNDISGNIYLPESLVDADAYHSTITVIEVPDESKGEEVADEAAGSGATRKTGYSGFPLAGEIYSGSNGNYGTHSSGETVDRYYTDGSVEFATGDGIQTREVLLAGKEGAYAAFRVPHIGRTHLRVCGGTMLNVYGGGDMATIDDETLVEIEYPDDNPGARAKLAGTDEAAMFARLMGITEAGRIQETYSEDAKGMLTFDYQLNRVFGGNNHTDMDIQPSWNLVRGHIGSLYSGGNFGRMTYFNPTPGENQNMGLTLTLESRDLHVNAVYGGGRVGDISPRIHARETGQDGNGTQQAVTIPDDFYGATLEVYDGVIDHVYGGNDVSGNVEYGTRVDIRGAISGDVYCAGNGNYRYLYDTSLPVGSNIVEKYDSEYGGTYFRLPLRNNFSGETPVQAQKILAINSYRPNVEKAWMSICGTETRRAYVRGNVYCGGNSSTISGGDTGADTDIRFSIGDYVTLNGIFMGSNGQGLVDMMYDTERLNGFDLTKANDLTQAQADATDNDKDAADRTYYPMLLDLYMRAVEVKGVPRDFNIDDNLTESYIGHFYAGGNKGSMLSTRTIDLTFPSSLVIYGKIVGGCNDANVTYKGVKHIGGLTRPLADGYTDKVHLKVHSRFEPWRLQYPVEDDIRFIELVPNVEAEGDKKYFPRRACNVFGGCFDSGRTLGDIRVDLYSDLTAEYEPDTEIGRQLAEKYGIGTAPGLTSKRRVIAGGVADKERRTFSVVGAGCGEDTEVYGNTYVRLMPSAGEARPSAGTVFGGSQEGLLVGNSRVELRDGMVLTNVYGGSESYAMYGSTQVIIGYPRYYVCNVAGDYNINRTDNLSKAATGNWTNRDNSQVIKNHINLRAGDVISERLYDQLDADKRSDTFFTYVDNDRPSNAALYGEGLSWDDIDIAVGHPGSRTNPDSEYFGFGNVYGGGYMASSASVTLAGENTVCSFTDKYKLGTDDIGRGGNSTILIWDNPENAWDIASDKPRTGNVATGEKDSDNAAIRDHIDISTGKYIAADLSEGSDVMGLWKYNALINRFEHMPARKYTADEQAAGTKYYRIKSDGGIYGGGRKVFVENFSDVDIAYYGYAECSPQFPKLLNTVQHIDLLSVTDCCIQLQGATDFATNSINATPYSMTRIGELSMHSSIPSTMQLDPGVNEGTGYFNTRHEKCRSRNYLSFYNDVHYLSAITSSEDFGNAHRKDDGTFTGGDKSYRDYKEERINAYYAIRNANSQSSVETAEAKAAAKKEFDKRNVGTAANLIGINNGYVLTVQGARVNNNGKDEIYYGPVNGVVEVKLLTLTEGEGGGYVFALNQHDNPNSFLETTGNFVFPGAAYKVTDNSEANFNYIYDDCYPLGSGWDKYWGWTETSTYSGHSPAPSLVRQSMSRASLVPVDTGHGDCNEEQEIHYWYVSGTKYYYNVTLTALTSANDKEFTIDNSDALIYLYGVQPGAKFKVKEVVWEQSTNQEPDLTYTAAGDRPESLDYKLYLTVDDNPMRVRTPVDTDSDGSRNWYATSIPRANYEGGNTIDTDAMPVAEDAASNAYGSLGDNMPLLGIALVDKVDNSGRAYYDKHLANDEKVRIVLTTDNEGEEFTYTVNLTIKYLLGPSISGHLNIENGALPGEYIYANSFDVTVDMDEASMVVSDYNWYIISDNEDISSESRIKEIVDYLNGEPGGRQAVAQKINDQKFINDKQVHIPAYLYRNGWNVVHEIVANNVSFFVLAGTDEDEADAPEYTKHLLVHNYHRMRPYDGTSILTDSDGNPVDAAGNAVYDASGYVEKYEDLQLVEGARIYIEDDADMEYFFTWLRRLQLPSSRTAPDGRVIDPRFAEGLNVYLMNNVRMPASVKVDDLEFKGAFHGNGYSIDMGDNTMFIGHNSGLIVNTGFVCASNSSSNSFRVIGENTGSGVIANSFFYNAKSLDKGALLKGEYNLGIVIDCYQTGSATTYVSGLKTVDYDTFNYGKVAFNLNRFYLNERYVRATGNNRDATVEPLFDYYRNGDYRFARYSSNGDATALRTAPVPNYRDYRGIRIAIDQGRYGSVTGADATMHNTADLVDESRVVYNASNAVDHYEPLFPADFLFFGQDLAQIRSVAPTVVDYKGVPCHISDVNRVYRASGYYGSNIDRGYHFNASAIAQHPALTAIDFAGYRDRQLGDRYTYDDNANSDAAYRSLQPDVYYAPMLDLPAQLDDFVTSGVTRNLLVYADTEADGNALLGDALTAYRYDADTDEAAINLHLISSNLVDGSSANPLATPSTADRPTIELFHLVDKEDFNAPILFNVTGKAWYDRKPEVFSLVGNDAWTGLCLPFTVREVSGAIPAGYGLAAKRNRGVMTHFYGSESNTGYYRMSGGSLVPVEGYENEAPSHEYWLRKFTSSKVEETDGTRSVYFARPGGTDDVLVNSGNGYTDETRSFNYSNTYFSQVYGAGYTDETTHSRPPYTSEGAYYADYPLITHGHPYIVAFPGETFYEFDLSGKFYSQRIDGLEPVAQTVTYSATPETGVEVVVPVTTEDELLGVEHDGYTFRGTFMHLPVAAGSGIALIEEDEATSHTEFTTAASGTVYPFRAYMQRTDSRYDPLYISSRSIDTIGDEIVDEGLGDDNDAVLKVYVEHNTLTIDSPFDTDVTVYGVDGRAVRALHVSQGINSYPGLAPGFYLVLRTKIRIN